MEPRSISPHHEHHRLAYAALIAVCIFWGGTYLAIRIAVETIPPLYLISGRYIVSGAIMLIVAAAAGAKLPRGRELFYTAICGAICIGIGNSFLAIAEQWIPSGLAALFYATSPFWMVGIDGLLPHGHRPRASSLIGLIVGVAGVVYLVLPAVHGEGITGRTVVGFFVLQISAVGWALGALLQKRVHSRTPPFLIGAVQQFAAGIAVALPAVILERPPHSISVRSEIAVGYLVVFGAIIGFSSFVYAMARLPIALVSIYTFVNPIVAVFVGWLLANEPFGRRDLIAMAIIFAGIAVVRWSEINRKEIVSVPSAEEAGAIAAGE